MLKTRDHNVCQEEFTDCEMVVDTVVDEATNSCDGAMVKFVSEQDECLQTEKEGYIYKSETGVVDRHVCNVSSNNIWHSQGPV